MGVFDGGFGGRAPTPNPSLEGGAFMIELVPPAACPYGIVRLARHCCQNGWNLPTPTDGIVHISQTARELASKQTEHRPTHYRHVELASQ